METVEIEVQGLEHVNTYPATIDLPQIKPRTLMNRHEFFTQIPHLKGADLDDSNFD